MSAAWARDLSEGPLEIPLEITWKSNNELACLLRSDSEQCMSLDDWIQPATAKLVGVTTDVPLSFGRLLQTIENFHEDVRLNLVNALILAFTDNLVNLPMSYDIPVVYVDLTKEVQRHLKMPESKAKLLIFSLAGNNNIGLYKHDDIIVFYCMPEDAEEFMSTLPGYNRGKTIESELTLMYRQLSSIIDYRLCLDFDMATKASIASAEMRTATESEIIQESPSLMVPRLFPLEQQLIPANKVSTKSYDQRSWDLLSRQRAGDRLNAKDVSIVGCEKKERFVGFIIKNL